MIKHPGDSVPVDMPKDLGRVHAALNMPIDHPPEALLQRILDSRAAGTRTILPVDDARPSGARSGVARGLIAAGLLFAALAAWSLLSGRNHRPASLADGDLIDFGLFTPAFARTMDKPKYPAIAVDAARLHPLHLTYNHRSLKNGTLITERPFRIYTLEPVGGARPGWNLITETLFIRPAGVPQPVWRAFIDTLRLDRTTLEPVDLVSRIERRDDGQWRRNHFDIRDTVALLHSTRHGSFAGADLKRPETYDTIFPITRDRFPRVVLHGQWITDLMAAPLAAGWKGSVTQLMLGVLDSTLPIDFAVTGEESIDTPTGRLACWKLAARFGSATNLTLLVRKSDGVLVSERWERKDGRDTIVNEMVLVGEK